MSARSKTQLSRLFSAFGCAALLALGVARSARAADEVADPFADTPPAGAPAGKPSGSAVPPAPAAAPTESAASILPGAIEELPASAYPEPVTRGLYGGPLWLDMQGLQWPYTPRTGIGFSGYGWLDNDYKLTRLGGSQDPGVANPHSTTLFQQGRFLFRVTPTYTNGSWFVQAQAEIVANKQQLDPQPNYVDADDVWVRTGVWNQWDVTVGRFQAFDVYPLGMGLDLNTDERIGAYDGTNGAGTVPQLYNAEYLFNRPAGPGNVALHAYPIRPLRIEVLAQWGNNDLLNQIGGRPAAIFDVGWLKLRLAGEYQWSFAQDSSPAAQNDQRKRGVAGSVQIVLAPYVELGVNAGAAVIDVVDANSAGKENLTASGNRLSYGGFIDATPLPGPLPNFMIGAGGNFASFHDLFVNPATNAYDRSTNTQVYGAAQYLFFRELYVKLVIGYAKSHFESSKATPYDDDQYSARLRVMYLY
jgi:hypothetical protein